MAWKLGQSIGWDSTSFAADDQPAVHQFHKAHENQFP